MRTLDEFKQDIKAYIDCYLENNDEFTEKNEKKYRKIQENDEILTKLAENLYQNKVLNSITDIDSFNYERNYYISELLEKEI